jgi:hypothetical protein
MFAAATLSPFPATTGVPPAPFQAPQPLPMVDFYDN